MDVDPSVYIVFSPRLCIILLYSTSNSISMTATTDYGVVACNATMKLSVRLETISAVTA
jgi:hypothetical protein